MLDRILSFSIHHRWLVVMLTAAAALVGVFTIQRLPIDAVKIHNLYAVKRTRLGEQVEQGEVVAIEKHCQKREGPAQRAR